MTPTQTHDVVICGGGMAGLTLARQLRQTLPELDVAVVEPSTRPLPPAAHKVGESSVELGSIYLRRLGLRDYLKDEHIIKLALRFFPGGGDLPIQERDELGPGRQPLMVSYQMDRGKLETDLRQMITDAGATLYEGAKVTRVELTPGDAPHTVHLDGDGAPATLTAGWVVDATGRRALIRRDQKLTRATEHAANAGWFRLEGRLDLSDMCQSDDREWRSRPTATERWRSTIHLMGTGYWVWVIPLVGDRTSIGIVAHEPSHAFDDVRTLDRCLDFLERNEPRFAEYLRAYIDGGREVLDFRCLKRYSYNVDRWLSTDRWSVVGEAGAFIDPLYSPGADSIAISNSFTVEAIRASRDGTLDARVAELQAQVAATVRWGFAFFTDSGPIYRHARAMTTKYYWDNFLYWNFLCQYFAQDIYRLTGDALERFSPIRDAFYDLNLKVQALLHAWVELDEHTPEGRFIAVPKFPSLLIESNLSLLNEMGPEETYDYMQLRVPQAEQMVGEIALRVLAELGPERGAALIEKTGLDTWGLDITERRLDAETLDPKKRRARLGKVGRELDDHLYPLRPHQDALAAMRLALTGRADEAA